MIFNEISVKICNYIARVHLDDDDKTGCLGDRNNLGCFYSSTIKNYFRDCLIYYWEECEKILEFYVEIYF